MTAPFFLDTNILVYATSLSPDHIPKRDVARAWVGRGDWGVSTQVLMEFYAQARQPRHGLLPTAAQAFVERIAARRPVQAVDKDLGRSHPVRCAATGRRHGGQRRHGTWPRLRRRQGHEPVRGNT